MNNYLNIIPKAKLLFAQKGYMSMVDKDIIESCGIDREDFYTQFKSKEDLFVLILDTINLDIDALIFATYADQQLKSEQKINLYIQNYMEHMLMLHIDVYRMSMAPISKVQFPHIQCSYQQLEYQLSRLLLEIMNLILYGNHSETSLLIWKKDDLQQQMDQANAPKLWQALEVQESLYYSKVFLHAEWITVNQKHERWQQMNQLEQDRMSSQDRCALVATFLHFMEKYPIVITESFSVTEHHSYGLH